jgi:hypothetical protein
MPRRADYEVGYGKPPKHTQFKKDQSGNPKGRPRVVKKSAPLVEAFKERVTVIQENGRRRQITKLQAAFAQLANRAARGGVKSAELLDIGKEIERLTAVSTEAGPLAKEVNDAKDKLQRLLDNIRDRLLQNEPGGTTGAGDGPGGGDDPGGDDS